MTSDALGCLHLRRSVSIPSLPTSYSRTSPVSCQPWREYISVMTSPRNARQLWMRGRSMYSDVLTGRRGTTWSNCGPPKCKYVRGVLLNPLKLLNRLIAPGAPIGSRDYPCAATIRHAKLLYLESGQAVA